MEKKGKAEEELKRELHELRLAFNSFKAENTKEKEELIKIIDSLKQSEKSLKSIISSIQDIMFTLDCNLKHTGVYGPWIQQGGLTEEYFLGKTALEIMGEEKGKLHKEAATEALEGKFIVYEWSEYSNNQQLFFQTSLSPIFDESGIVTGLVGIGRNITNKKRAEEGLEYEKTRLEGILSGTNVGTWEWNVQTGDTVFNERWAEIIGYNLKELSPVSIDTWIKHVHPDDLIKCNELLDRHFRGETEFYEAEARMKHKEGYWIWILDKGKLISRNNDGKPLLMMGTHQDITERKRAEQSLKESENRYRELVDLAVDGIIQSDNTGKIIHANEAFYQIVGLEKESITGKNLTDIPFDEECIKCRPLRLDLLKQGVVVGNERSIICPDGSIVHIDMKSKMMPDGTFQLIFRDITEKKKAQTELLEKTKELDRYFTSSLDLLCIADTEGHFIRLNPEWEKVLGYSVSDLQGKIFLDYVHPDDVQITLEALSRLSNQEEVLCFENRYRCKDGSYRWIEWRSHPQETIIYAAARDITVRKHAEELLKENEERLRILFDQAADAIYVSNSMGQLTEVNEKACQTLGYTKNELLGMKIFDIDNDFNSKDKIDTVFGILEKEKSLTIESFHKRKDGTLFPVEIKIAMLDTPDGAGMIGIARDITERKKAEKELLKERQRLEGIIKGTNAGTWEWYIQEQVLNLNDRWAEMIGYKLGEIQPFIAEKWLSLAHPDDIKESEILINKHINGEIDYYEIEIRMKHKKGNWVWVLDRGMITERSVDGKPLIMMGTRQDITERKLAEEALRESRENLSTTLNSIGDGVIATDRNGIITNINPVAQRLCGWTFNEAIGRQLKDIFKIIDSETKDDICDPVEKVLRKGEIIGLANHTELVSRDGTKFQIADSAAPIKNKNGEIIGVVMVFSDITKEYSIRQDMENTNRLLTAVIEQSSVPMLLVTAKEGEIKYVNQACLDFVGEPDYPVSGTKLKDIDWTWKNYTLDDEFIPLPETPLGKALHGESVHNQEIKLIDKNGNVKYDLADSFPIRDTNGNIMAGFLIFQDITERVIAQKQLMESKLKAEESDRLKSAFLANMSHEIRTPMNGILGFASLLKEPGLTGKEQQEYIRIIEKSGVRMLNIINDIIDISKIEAGLVEVNRKKTNILEQMEYIYTLFRPEVENKGLKLIYNIPVKSDEYIVLTDKEKVYAVLTNLVKNAIKYTRNGYIEFGCCKSGNSIEVYVKDTGIGIPKERQDAIFERFIQADIDDSLAIQGAGLGLSISKAYVEMIGGKIRVESEEGMGSTFYFTVPLLQETEIITESFNKDNNDRIKGEQKKLKVLIVEDDFTSEMLMNIALGKVCRELLTAGDGMEAIEVARNNPDLDLILLDIRLPKVSGYDVAKQIRQFNKNVIIIAQTAYGLSGDKEKSIEAGCNDYISKPVNRDVLHKKINNFFGN